MSEPEFVKIEHLEEALAAARELVKQSGREYRLNFSLKVEIDISRIREPQLLDAQKLAEQFQATTAPPNLYFSHGQYITPGEVGVDGIEHLIRELKHKDTSNRAIVSLISQRDIVGSGDNPIPSFMVIQCNVEDRVLYVTAYFRALEVINFLPINLEELRLVINRIYAEFRRIESVKVHVFAFRAYCKEERNPLVKPDIELLDIADVLTLMRTDPKKLAPLLEQMRTDSTVVRDRPLRNIYEIVTSELKSKLVQDCFTRPYFKKLLEDCLESSSQLIELRRRESHHPDIDKLNQKYLGLLGQLVEEIRKTCQ
jgi:hypothetical protein